MAVADKDLELTVSVRDLDVFQQVTDCLELAVEALKKCEGSDDPYSANIAAEARSEIGRIVHAINVDVQRAAADVDRKRRESL